MLAALLVTACASPSEIVVLPEPSLPEQETPASKPYILQTRLRSIPFTIQVGAFSTTARAARFAAGLQNQGLDAYYFIDEDGLCKVRFERFEDKTGARQRALELQDAGRIDDFYIVQPASPTRQRNPRFVLRNNLVRTAHRFIGTPYRWGGESASNGFDCSGLTMTVYRLNGLELPRNSRSQFSVGVPVHGESLMKGDLVFFATNGNGRVSHVGIYTGQGKFIHAPGRGKRIRSASLANRYFKNRYIGARRYF